MYYAIMLQGVPITSIAQAIQDEHYMEFDYLLGMDRNNVRNLESFKPKSSKAQSKLQLTKLNYLTDLTLFYILTASPRTISSFPNI